MKKITRDNDKKTHNDKQNDLGGIYITQHFCASSYRASKHMQQIFIELKEKQIM